MCLFCYEDGSKSGAKNVLKIDRVCCIIHLVQSISTQELHRFGTRISYPVQNFPQCCLLDSDFEIHQRYRCTLSALRKDTIQGDV